MTQSLAGGFFAETSCCQNDRRASGDPAGLNVDGTMLSGWYSVAARIQADHGGGTALRVVTIRGAVRVPYFKPPDPSGSTKRQFV
jgi:hypothetical protein